jgi:hypothetical protein
MSMTGKLRVGAILKFSPGGCDPTFWKVLSIFRYNQTYSITIFSLNPLNLGMILEDRYLPIINDEYHTYI